MLRHFSEWVVGCLVLYDQALADFPIFTSAQNTSTKSINKTFAFSTLLCHCLDTLLWYEGFAI
jgi:hypothetical protein